MKLKRNVHIVNTDSKVAKLVIYGELKKDIRDRITEKLIQKGINLVIVRISLVSKEILEMV